MPSIQHKDIPDNNRHEPKGISTATNGQVYVASGTGSGTWATPKQVMEITAALTPAAVGANTTAEQTFTVTGLLTTDKLLQVIKPTQQTNLGIAGFRISALNTLAITYVHTGGGSVTPSAETYSIIIWR
jgi:hypothetical protein